MVLGKRVLAVVRLNRRGNAVVEFALILPILLAVVFGITEFGRAWLTVNVMNTAVREGARLAVVTGPDVSAVKSRVTAVLTAAKVTAKTITVTGPDSADPERKVTVSVTSDFKVLPGKILGTFKGTIPLQASTTMRHESL